MELAPQLTEPTIIPDVFTTGVARAVPISGGCVRLTWYVDLPLACDAGEIEHRIVDRLIIPQEAIPDLISKLYSAMDVLRDCGVSLDVLAKLAH